MGVWCSTKGGAITTKKFTIGLQLGMHFQANYYFVSIIFHCSAKVRKLAVTHPTR